jgi:hypothetical protein
MKISKSLKKISKSIPLKSIMYIAVGLLSLAMLLLITSYLSKYEWVEKSLGVFGGLLAPVIAIVVAYIAYEQHRIESAKLRLALFDRRWEVYEAFRAFLDDVMGGQDGSSANMIASLQKFYGSTRTCDFLFGRDIADYRTQLHHKFVDLMAKQREMNELEVGEERTRVVKEETEIVKWLAAQFNQLPKIFASYMSFEMVKRKG